MLFSPAVAVLDRLRYPYKFALISVIIALPIVFLGLATYGAYAERLHDMITGIASAAEQQTQVCEEINRNIVGVQDAAGDTAAAADQAASLGARLADQARQLQQIVGRFTLP
jgi:predicted PurR-regulated permease PerM